MSRRIAARRLFPLTSRNSCIDNGFVEIDDDGVVLRTGVCTDVRAEDEYYDGAVVPGFVNTHCHIELSHMQGRMPKGTGMAEFIDIISEQRDDASVDEKKRCIKRWMDALWEQGVQAMGDISNEDISFGIKASHPMYTRTFLEVFGTEPEDADKIVAGVLELNSRADALGIDAAPTPHACYTTSPELVTACSREGLKSGFLSYHCEESDQEEEMLMCGSGPLWKTRKRQNMSTPPVVPGRSALEYFVERVSAGMETPVDGNILLVHEVCMDEKGAKAAAAAFRHPYVALCPLSNLFIHDKLAPVMQMRDWPVTLTVGTDSLTSNDTLCMVDELYCLQSRFGLGLDELLGWACTNGARFLGKGDVMGSIEPGKKPGLVFISGLDGEGRLTESSVSRRII